MRIGFDAFPFQEKPSGIGKYIIALIENIIEEIPDAEFIAYSNKSILVPESIKKHTIQKLFNQGFQSKLPGKVWLKFFGGHCLKDDCLDFYLSTSGFFPSLPKNVKKIAVIHDFNYKIVPETMGKMHYLTHFLFFKNDVKSADFVICNSQGTADKLKTYFNKDSDEIINPPVSDLYCKRPLLEINLVKEKYKINDEYILFVGNLEPRKNLKFVIENYIALINSTKIANVKLVIVGLKGWNDSSIQLLLEKYNKDILVLGYVDEEDLPAIYSGAKVFVFPSLYEGFGIPVREALLCGTSVITSKIPELIEASSIALDMVSFVNGNDYNDFQKCIINHINHNEIMDLPVNTKKTIQKTISFLTTIGTLQN